MRRGPVDELVSAYAPRAREMWPLLAPTLAGIITFGVAYSTAPRHAPRDFFSVSADIIAVLFLAAALEARVLAV